MLPAALKSVYSSLRSPLPLSPLSSFTCSFQDFDLQGSHRCSSDWMSVSSYRSLEGLRVCGSSLPPPFTSSQDHVWIHFHSDESLTGKGFRLSYISGQHLGALAPPTSSV